MELQRSHQQGYPSTPYLFLLTVDVLGHMLQNPTHGVLVMLLPNGAQSRSQMFIDDTAFYLARSKENIERTMAMLHKFGVVSRAKLNLTKSIAIWVLPKEKDWPWGKAKGLKWQKKISSKKFFSS